MRLLKALRREPVDRTPVWFMRQAGRYMAEYRELRKKHTILEICATPELSAQVTLQPLARFPGLDAGIIFSDILTVVQAMGTRVEFVVNEGPAIRNPVTNRADVEALHPPDFEGSISSVYKAIGMVKKEISIPLIGFAGAPFTLASYLVEGGPSKEFTKTRAMMKTDAWEPLMKALSAAVRGHLDHQVAAGVDVVQLFDSWVGNLTPEEYRRHVLPHSASILRGLPVPSIHFGTKTAPLLELMRETEATCIGVDWRIPLDEAWGRLGDVAVQGNLHPEALLGPRDELIRKVDDVLDRAGGRVGHVFNLGHGILPKTPLESVDAIIERVQERTSR